jgi:chorismate synthase
VTFSRLRLLTAGESHGPALTAIIEGIPAGIRLSPDDLSRDLARRQGLAGDGGRPYLGASARMRLERDRADITAGVMGGLTTGGPIALHIANADHARWRGTPLQPLTVPRPGHADLVGAVKYGYEDLRLSLERASARETAARVAAGAVCRCVLSQFDIRVGSCVTAIAGVEFDGRAMAVAERLERAEASPLRCPGEAATRAMEARIREVAIAHETAGGVFEVLALGVPPGLGSYASWDRRLDARLAAAIMSVPAIKGVEIGDGFRLAAMSASDAQDHLRFGADGDRVERTANHAGGLEGGVTTGDTLVVRAAMKPLATSVKRQPSVDLAERVDGESSYQRSDVCAVPRAAVVAEAMVCLVVADALMEKLGGDSVAEMRPRFDGLRRARGSDLPMRAESAVYWE